MFAAPLSGVVSDSFRVLVRGTSAITYRKHPGSSVSGTGSMTSLFNGPTMIFTDLRITHLEMVRELKVLQAEGFWIPNC